MLAGLDAGDLNGVTDATPQPVRLGRIVGLFGVRGWVKVFSFTDPREAILDYGDWMLGKDGAWRPVELEEGKRHGKSVLAKLAGADDRDAAVELLGLEVAVPRSALPEPGNEQYYWTDLEGLAVWHRDERLLGTVRQILETGAHDVMVVRPGEGGDKEVLVPFVVGEVVTDVDLDAGVIRVDWEWD